MYARDVARNFRRKNTGNACKELSSEVHKRGSKEITRTACKHCSMEQYKKVWKKSRVELGRKVSNNKARNKARKYARNVARK